MKNSSAFLILTVSSTLLCMASLADAQEWNFQPRVTAGVMKYEFKQDDFFSVKTTTVKGSDVRNSVSMEGVKRSDWLPYIGVGATISYDRFFIDLYGLKTAVGEQKNISQSTINSSSLDRVSTVTEFMLTGDSDIERSDYSVSVGYNPLESLVVFLGYKGSETKFDNNVLWNAKIDNVPFFSPVPVRIKQNLKQRGPFLGAAYAWSIMDKGVLSVNMSLGSFNGKVKEIWDAQALGQQSVGLDGDVIGLALGLSWRGNITENLGYSISVNGYNYNYDSSKDNSANFSESVFNLSAGLSYRF